ncbi:MULTISPECIES: hypothetical protein [unclassified Methylobacterium]|jgi:hypothetical protein|uniref:hypothetical protein n=1 Tax=unclassified Methylobacterium TaxID=2615210 RepID=UPI0013549452|nr:hypothetical protein [Methylobacterium sp. 2A]MWV23147.1 hypothetical protein [Methylobacterium sp. 2A]
MLKDTDVRSVANEIFSRALGPDRFDHLDVEVGPDHYGDPSLFVALYFRPGVDPRDVADISNAHADLRQRLLDLDEERFPYLRKHFADDEILGDDGAETP